MLRSLFPANFRHALRHGFDGLFCDRSVSVKKIGGSAAWAVVPGRLVEGACVLSGGAGKDISFEVELARQYGCRVAVFDPSPGGLETFQCQGVGVPNLACHPLGLAGESSVVTFALPLDPSEGSFTLPGQKTGEVHTTFRCLSPADAFAQAGFSHLELLKLDIEGFEYAFLERLLSLGHRPAQIAVEVHHFLPHVSLFTTLRCFRGLRQTGYRMVRKERFDYLFVHESALNGIPATIP